MKTYTNYLAQSKKTYQFRVKVAGDYTEKLQERIQSALDAFSVASVGKIKRLPIQEYAEFPQMGNVEIHVIEVELDYPTNPPQLTQLIHERVGIPIQCLSVRTALEDAEAIAAMPTPRKKAALETPELEEAPGGQALVGQARRDSLLKELMTREYEFAAKSEADKKTTNELPQGNTSPVGTSQTKITSPVKGTK
jgi:hypothetical protein